MVNSEYFILIKVNKLLKVFVFENLKCLNDNINELNCF